MKLAAIAALAWSATAAADPIDITNELRAIGARRARELAVKPPGDHDLAAAGPCLRPTSAQRDAITRAVDAWIGRTNPGSRASSALELEFGCIDREGVVVDAQQDLEQGALGAGHWWILRVNADRVDELAAVTGTPLGSFMEFAVEATIATVVLADVDHDGVVDVIALRDGREGGSSRHDGTLSLILSSTHHMRPIGNVGGEVTVGSGATANLVLAITDRDHATVYRCVASNATLSRCADAERAHRFADSVAAAALLARTGSSDAPVPTRDDLATELDAVGVTGSDRDRLLAAVSPTSPAHHALRRIQTALAATADRTADEQTAEREAYYNQLRTALGDTSCADAIAREPQLDVWLAAHAMAGAQVLARCVGTAGRYYLVEREVPRPTGDTGLTRAVLFVAGDVTTELATATTSLAGPDEIVDPDAPPLEALFYHHGPAMLAIAIDGVKLAAFSSARPIAQRTGAFVRYADADDAPFDTLIVDHSPTARGSSILHLTDRIRPIDGKAGALIAARSAAAAAHTLLAGLNDAALVQYRDQVVAALRVIDAEPSLIAEVRQLAKP